jgi:competence protein ComGC
MDTPPSSAPEAKNSGLAIWSLVLGILGLVLLLFCVGPLFAIPAVICGHIAYGRIKRSGGALSGQGLALAGLITGYVTIGLAIIVIPMMAAIAIPNFVKARDTAQKNQCINNLRIIDGAKQQWALENNKTADAIPTAQDLDKYIPKGFNSLHCAKDGTYTINKVGEAPTCSVPEHHLP